MSSMTKHFNALTPKEAELLTWLMEECSETCHAIGKIQRHGLDRTDPRTHMQNRAKLELEVGQVVAAIAYAVGAGILDLPSISAAAREKVVSVKPYLHHYSDPE